MVEAVSLAVDEVDIVRTADVAVVAPAPTPEVWEGTRASVELRPYPARSARIGQSAASR